MMRVLAALFVAMVFVAPGAEARPQYFAAITQHYGLVEGDPLYACGICHRLWTGTGARNPFGRSVEDQLYLGKPILTVIDDVASGDADEDGFTNDDELRVHRTLPGFSCTNFDLAIDPPPYFQSIITPEVPTCLEPKDVKVEPMAVDLVTEVGKTGRLDVVVSNHGAQLPIAVSSVALVGAAASLSLEAATAPVDLPVGGRMTVTVAFVPTAPGLANGSLRIVTDDPDEPQIDLPITALSFASQRAPAEDRAACPRDVAKQMERYTKAHLREWTKCWSDELAGVACEAGKRDLKVRRAEVKLRAAVGGAADRRCAPKSMSPLRLGLPQTCGGACAGIQLAKLADLASCLVCRQREATNAMLGAVVGAAPPDLPRTRLSGAPLVCNRGLLDVAGKAILGSQKVLDTCRVDAITAPADCATSTAAALAEQASKVTDRFGRCTDTAGMGGCRFVEEPDPACLEKTVGAVAGELATAVFGPE